MREIALILAVPLAFGPLPLAAAPDQSDPSPTVILTDANLRALAEIDGDPETLTAEERQKMTHSRQVLGMQPGEMPLLLLPARAETP